MTRLQQLGDLGQAAWLDFLRRRWIADELPAQIRSGICGVTSNPSIFEKAIGESAEYDDDLRARLQTSERSSSVTALYEALAIADIQAAAEALRPLYEASRGADGFVSLEVSPYLANDTDGTIQEARRLWKTVARPNVMIKVPGTAAGVPAINTLIGEGININVTLLFSIESYEQVALAYLSGLETWRRSGGDLARVSSVASFFVSRIDTAVDKKLDALAHQSAQAELIDRLRGKIAVANAKRAYQRFRALYSRPRWQELAATGARPQRLLWASTGVKNPRYADTLYVDELIGRETVNTMPPATLEAFADHGRVRADAIETGLSEAEQQLGELENLGISLDEITTALVADGVRLFADAFDQLLGALASKRQRFLDNGVLRQEVRLPPDMAKRWEREQNTWREQGNARRLWQGDAALWTGKDEAQWLGWLSSIEDGAAHSTPLAALAQEVQQKKPSDVVLLGMGGSSLGPEVIARTLANGSAGWPRFHMLDSTDPAQVRAVENAVDLKNTWFIVSSKSGSTLEPNIFKAHFCARTAEVVGAERAAERFIAITDPGSALEKSASSEGFAHIFPGKPSIGGRYSVLSNFGLIPAAAIGIDVPAFLERASEMRVRCGADVPPAENPGISLGLLLGVLARDYGRDKVTVSATPALSSFGAWLEQLIAESTGKQGTGLIPVDNEPLTSPQGYGNDRVFVHVQTAADGDAKADGALDVLAKAGHPVICITLPDARDLGGEFFRWEVATAAAGSVLGINPFDQPDVEASKVKTRALTDQFEREGHLPDEKPLFEKDGIAVFCAPADAALLGAEPSVTAALRAHFARIKPGDYIALLAYIARNDAHGKRLQALRILLRDHYCVATCLGFGPRFLHSTGQAYKGGPNTGVFLQLTCDDPADIPVPGHRYSFSVVKSAQARGDLGVLFERGRRALRLHLRDLEQGLATLQAALEAIVR